MLASIHSEYDGLCRATVDVLYTQSEMFSTSLYRLSLDFGSTGTSVLDH